MSFVRFFVPVVFVIGGCATTDDQPTRYTLKLVATPQGQPASAQCVETGESSGDTDGSNLTAGAWTEVEGHTDGITTYEIRITGHDGVVHRWHYDEAMARTGAALSDEYTDSDGTTAISIVGIFQRVDPCMP